MFYSYILQSVPAPKFIYKGMTQDFNHRFEMHSKGRVPSTKSYLPLRIIHVEICKNADEARKLEKFFKSGYGREIIDEIMQFS